MAMEENILAINLGSSSKKYALYVRDACVFAAHFEKTETGFAVTYDGGAAEEINAAGYEHALAQVLTYAKKIYCGTLRAVGIRIVAVGRHFADHTRIDAAYRDMLAREAERDPDHIPLVVAELAELKRLLPDTSVIAVSDSAFHTTMPEVARRYALPRDIAERDDIVHAGFHGLSVASAAGHLEKITGVMPARTLVCHLGSGASVTALLHGKSIATSMGYSPLSGVPMSTRVGDSDPEAVLRLAEEYGIAETRKILYTTSGLLALSEQSGDMRVLLDAEKRGDARAAFAIESFVYHVRLFIGAYAAVLGGVDALVFSGTIGVRSEPLRSRIAKDFSYKTFVIKTNEELEIVKVVRAMFS